jgi:hypothetical protein
VQPLGQEQGRRAQRGSDDSGDDQRLKHESPLFGSLCQPSPPLTAVYRKQALPG